MGCELVRALTFILKCPPAAKKKNHRMFLKGNFLFGFLYPWKNFRCRLIVIPSYVLPDKETAPINAAINSFLFIFKKCREICLAFISNYWKKGTVYNKSLRFGTHLLSRSVKFLSCIYRFNFVKFRCLFISVHPSHNTEKKKPPFYMVNINCILPPSWRESITCFVQNFLCFCFVPIFQSFSMYSLLRCFVISE